MTASQEVLMPTDQFDQMTAALAYATETSANLAAYVEQCAQEIAAPRVAEAERAAAAALVDIEQTATFEKQRADDLIAEFRRVLAVQERQLDRLIPMERRLQFLWASLNPGEFKDQVFEAWQPENTSDLAAS
jgi:hypothetical protein